MKKINEKILELLDNGYGLIQMMEHPEVKINKEELIALMKDDEKLNKKLRKRFGDKFLKLKNLRTQILNSLKMANLNSLREILNLRTENRLKNLNRKNLKFLKLIL